MSKERRHTHLRRLEIYWIKVMRVKEHRVENTVVKKLPPKEKGEQEERKERE